MKMTTTLSIALALTISAVAAGAQPAVAQTAYPPPGPGINLLTNPGHEHPGSYFANRGEINVTWNWVPFWEEPPAGTDLRDVNYRTPEFRPPFARDYPDRVKSGGGSDRWFNYAALNKKAGIMQYVVNMPVGAPVRFTSYLQLWSSNDDFPLPSKKDANDGNLKVRVCIDQDGGVRDLTDPELVCSDWAQPNNKWEQLSVDGVAKNSAVNVIIWSTADLPVQHNDIYADESCFEVLPAAGAPGICKGAGLIPTGPNLAPVGEDAASIKNTTPVVVANQAPAASNTNAGVQAPAGDNPALAINAKTSLNVRQNPVQSAKVLGNVKRGTVLPVTGKTANNQWFQVTYNGQPGWVSAGLTLPNAAAKSVAVIGAAATTPATSAITPTTTTTATTASTAITSTTTTTATANNAGTAVPAGDGAAVTINAKVSLNLRAEPNPTSKVVGNAKRGAVLPVTGKTADGQWYQVDFNGAKAWVLANLIVPNAAAQSAPVVP